MMMRSTLRVMRKGLIVSALIVPATSVAMFSQPSALMNSGPVKVNVDIEISEAAKRLPQADVQAHVVNRLQTSAIPVVSDSTNSDVSGVVIAPRQPAQLWVHLEARRLSEPSGYLVVMEVSHLQTGTLQREHPVPVQGIGWHESWALIVPDGSDLVSATNAQLDSLIDAFSRDYQSANPPNSSPE